MRYHGGLTILEMVLVLLLAGILAGLAWPPLARARDGALVRAARDDLAVTIARTRSAALARGGATFVAEADTDRFWVRGAGADTVAGPVDVRARYGVGLETVGGPVAELRYDALGIGRLASRTFRLRRGDAEAGVTVSSYGRVRTW